MPACALRSVRSARSGSASPVSARGTCSAKIGDGDGGDQCPRAIGDAVDVAGHGNSRRSRDAGRLERRVLVHVVHVQQPGAIDQRRAGILHVERQPWIALPEHRAIPGLLIHQNQRATMAGRPRESGEWCRRRAARAPSRSPSPCSSSPSGADEGGAKAERRAGRERGRDLAAVSDMPRGRSAA